MIGLILGTRPEIIKMAPIVWELKKRKSEFVVIHTGQHYDYTLSQVFFEELELGKPDFFLNAGSESDARQTAKMMTSLEELLSRNKCGKKLGKKLSKIVVEGDTNSVLAASIVAKKQKRFLAHVEAGARSFDKTMPEEVNRIVCDHLSDLLFAPSATCRRNLLNEKISASAIIVSGNTQFETMAFALKKIKESKESKKSPERVAFPPAFEAPTELSLVTMHRQENSTPAKLRFLLKLLLALPGKKLFLLHPRVRKLLNASTARSFNKAGVEFSEPVAYLDLMRLLEKSSFVVTDSGGLQKEAAALNKPVIILRYATEWPEIVECGYACLAGLDEKSVEKARSFLKSFSPKKIVEVGGQPSKKIVDALLEC